MIREQVILASNGQVVLFINSPKPNYYKQTSLALPLPEMPNNPACPVAVLKRVFRICLSQLGSDPVFTCLTTLDPRPLKYGQFIKALRDVLEH